jgi:hypothetical protein
MLNLDLKKMTQVLNGGNIWGKPVGGGRVNIESDGGG